MVKSSEHVKRIGVREVPGWITVLFVLYTVLSFFETYLTVFIGTNTRYLIFLIAISFLCLNKGRIRKSYYILLFVLWFLFKVVSIGWSSMVNTDVSRLFVSQIGMIVLLTSVCGQIYDRRFIQTVVAANYWCSFIFGILTLRFHSAFISEVFSARQVLTLFGVQNDPNNCAAFLAIGVSIAAFSLVSEKRMRLLNTAVILVNAYGIMLTASRTGILLLAMIVIVLALVPNVNDDFVIRSFIKRLVLIVIVLVIGFFITKHYLPIDSLNRIIAFDEYAGGSGRAEKWNQAIELIKQKPFFGWGWGGYLVGAGIVHNTYLTMLCDIGIFGFALFIIPIVILIKGLLVNKYQLAILLLATGLFPAFALDCINKRFFWNAIIIAIMMLESYQRGTGIVKVWEEKTKKEYSENIYETHSNY